MTSYHQQLTDELNDRQDRIVGLNWYLNQPWSDGYDCPKGIRCDFAPGTSVKVLTNLWGIRVVSIVNGDHDVVYDGDSREQAIKIAIAKTVQIHKEWIPNDVEHGFEHEGQWITDRTKSPCGRFDLTEEESNELYGPAK